MIFILCIIGVLLLGTAVSELCHYPWTQKERLRRKNASDQVAEYEKKNGTGIFLE